MDEKQSCVAEQKMTRYTCHKEVRAFKIGRFKELGRGRVKIYPNAYASFVDAEVDAAYMDEHRPAVGGYYVVCDDGYESFWPAKEFEKRYTAQE